MRYFITIIIIIGWVGYVPAGLEITEINSFVKVIVQLLLKYCPTRANTGMNKYESRIRRILCLGHTYMGRHTRLWYFLSSVTAVFK